MYEIIGISPNKSINGVAITGNVFLFNYQTNKIQKAYFGVLSFDIEQENVSIEDFEKDRVPSFSIEALKIALEKRANNE